MKKPVTTVIILLLATSVGWAQSFHGGIKLGTNLQKVEGVPFAQKFSYGYQGGGFATIGINSKWSIQPEVLFTSNVVDTATKFSTVYGFKKIERIKFQYLDIPLILNYKIAKVLSFQVGPQFSVLLNRNNSLLTNGKDAFKSNNISALAGLQLNIVKFKIYTRYAYGFYNINNGDNEKWRNQNVQLGVGYKLF